MQNKSSYEVNKKCILKHSSTLFGILEILDISKTEENIKHNNQTEMMQILKMPVITLLVR